MNYWLKRQGCLSPAIIAGCAVVLAWLAMIAIAVAIAVATK